MPPGPNDQAVDAVSLAATLDELRRVRGLLEACETLLTAVEWEGDKTSAICPRCRAWQSAGHETTCDLAAAIGAPTRRLG